MASVMGPDYWCHRCHETVNLSPGEMMSCLRCSERFIELIRDRSPPVPRLFDLFSDGDGSSRRRCRSYLRNHDDEDGEGGPCLVVMGHSGIMEFMQALGSSYDRSVADNNDRDDDDDDADECRSEPPPSSEIGASVATVLVSGCTVRATHSNV